MFKDSAVIEQWKIKFFNFIIGVFYGFSGIRAGRKKISSG